VDFGSERPEFAFEAGMLALHWMVQGYGYEITGAEVWAAYSSTLAAADKAGAVEKVRERLKNLVGAEKPTGFVRSILGRRLGFDHP